jgi:hypothetical protein
LETGVSYVAGEKFVVDDKGTGVDVAYGIDETDHATGTTQIETLERRAERGQVEERIAS